VGCDFRQVHDRTGEAVELRLTNGDLDGDQIIPEDARAKVAGIVQRLAGLLRQVAMGSVDQPPTEAEPVASLLIVACKKSRRRQRVEIHYRLVRALVAHMMPKFGHIACMSQGKIFYRFRRKASR
jgi:hypothetical protein